MEYQEHEVLTGFRLMIENILQNDVKAAKYELKRLHAHFRTIGTLPENILCGLPEQNNRLIVYALMRHVEGM